MDHLRYARHSIALGLLMGALPVRMATSAEPAAASAASGSLPAVEGFNGKLSGFGGSSGGQAFYGGDGSLALPLGHVFGLQLDGVVADLDSDAAGSMTVFGAAGHLFWRDPSIGLVGLYGRYLHTDAFDGADLYAAGAEGAL